VIDYARYEEKMEKTETGPGAEF